MYCEDIKMTNDNHSLLDIYTHEIEKYPLMEKSVTEKMKSKNNEQLTNNEKELLITCNLRFVISEAKKFFSKNKNLHDKIDLMDLIQAGNIGLVDAVKKFDPSKGFCFITFARHDIRNRFLKSINMLSIGNNIKVPANSRHNRKLVYEAVSNFKSTHGRDATEKEISEVLGMKINVLRKYLSDSNGHTLSLEYMQSDSFFEPIQPIDDSSEEERNQENDSPLLNETVKGTLKRLIRDLPDRERKIIEMRYFQEKTLEDVANEFNITRERVRQIQFIALRKLKFVDEIKSLYYD
jgi:RNA polymerase primary sigma factor